MTRIGRITATETMPTTVDEFTFWLKDDVIIGPFDIVRVKNANNSVTFGIVKEISHITDSSGHLGDYVSHDFGDIETSSLTQRLGTTYVKAQVLSNDNDIFMPVPHGEVVEFASEEDVRKALGLDNIKDEVPAGYLVMTNGTTVPICFDRNFLIGPEGAHLNISGISGLATKTSYAMFMLQALQQKCADQVAVIILNVKGQDLLKLNEKNSDLANNDIDSWTKTGLACKPFDNVKYYYPFHYNINAKHAATYCESISLEYQFDSNFGKTYVYTYEEDRDKLDMLFANVDDPNFTIESIMTAIASEQEFTTLSNWDDFFNKLGQRSQAGGTHGKEIAVQSWRRFYRLIRTNIQSYKKGQFLFTNTVNNKINNCRLEDEIKQITGGDTYVIDIAKLSEHHQMLVFGDIIRSVYDLKLVGRDEEGEDGPPIPNYVVIFVDELNKYAPVNAPKSSPLLRYLLEISERGRSMGIVLFSAEQFRSAVEDRVKGNCSTQVYGRTNATEIAKSDYRYIPQTYKNTMTRLKKGDLLIDHPIFRTLLKLSFPMPSYRQR